MGPRSPQPVILIVEPFGGSTRLHNPNLPMVYWDDAAVTRGEGIFETVLVRDGQPANFERHAARFRASAELLGMPAPDPSYWRRATLEAAAEWYRQLGQDPATGFEGEAKCVWTYTRGRASTGNPSAWLRIEAIPPSVMEQREHGVSVMCAPRGWSTSETLHEDAPWLTFGAKTLNYTAAMAALRCARERGFDDVLWLGEDHETVLEGATSTLVIVKKGQRLRTPPSGGDVLPGTTQAAIFEYAQAHGWRCKEKELTVHDLERARSVWLVSSVRGAVPVMRIGETELEPRDLEEARELFTAAISATD